jgi:hypothetical protein
MVANQLEGNMVRSVVFAAALTALASPAFAAHCSQPYAPDTNIAPGAGKDAVTHLRQDVQAFLTASELYQKCLVEAAKADAAFKAQAVKLVEANQEDKERVGKAFNALVKSVGGA